MLKLILKDFSIQRSNLKRYLMSSLIISVVFFFTDMKTMAFAMATFPIIYGFINSSLYEDEKNNTLRLIASMPVKKELVVYARYASVIIVTVITGAVSWSISTTVAATGLIKDISFNEINVFIISTILTFVILVSVYLPMAFKLGYIKASNINRFVMLGLFGAFSAAGIALKNISKNSTPPELFLEIGEFFKNTDLYMLIAAAIFVVALIYLLSMKLSLKFFKRRDLFS